MADAKNGSVISRTMTPRSPVRAPRSPRASGLGRYPRLRAARITRSRVSGAMGMVVGAPLRTRETVLWDTPVARATSIIVGVPRTTPARRVVRVAEPSGPSASCTGPGSPDESLVSVSVARPSAASGRGHCVQVATRVPATLPLQTYAIVPIHGTLAGAAMTRHTISVDLDRRIGAIDRNVFGGFVEHLGRCVYGGIYEPGSPEAGPDGLRTDVLEAARRLRLRQHPLPGRQLRLGVPLA